MLVDVVQLPADLQPRHLVGRAVAVFDVLRATTTMTAALAAGVAAIRIYGDVPAVRAAAGGRGAADGGGTPADGGKAGGETTDATAGPRGGATLAPARPNGGAAPLLLCGEERCLPPAGFDLGNSPGALRPEAHAGATLLMSTTNGTKAVLAARPAAVRFAAAIVNASAAARALASTRLDVTLLCAGTDGRPAMEDLLGCGAVIDSLLKLGVGATPADDVARVARDLFAGNRHRLAEALADAEGGRNVAAAGLAADVGFAAVLDALDVVGVVADDEAGVPTVRRWGGTVG